MKPILLAILVACGIGLAGTSTSTIAAPVNGVVIGDAAKASNAVEQVQHWRRRSRRWHRRRGSFHSRWRSRRHFHNRWRSRRYFHNRWRSRRFF